MSPEPPYVHTRTIRVLPVPGACDHSLLPNRTCAECQGRGSLMAWEDIEAKPGPLRFFQTARMGSWEPPKKARGDLLSCGDVVENPGPAVSSSDSSPVTCPLGPEHRLLANPRQHNTHQCRANSTKSLDTENTALCVRKMLAVCEGAKVYHTKLCACHPKGNGIAQSPQMFLSRSPQQKTDTPEPIGTTGSAPHRLRSQSLCTHFRQNFHQGKASSSRIILPCPERPTSTPLVGKPHNPDCMAQNCASQPRKRRAGAAIPKC